MVSLFFLENEQQIELPPINKETIKNFAYLQNWGLTYIKMLRLRMKKLKHRKYVIQELIQTEEQYCKSLSIILKEVKIPTLENKILTKEESNQIFSVLDEIQNFHSFFSEKLKKSFDKRSLT